MTDEPGRPRGPEPARGGSTKATADGNAPATAGIEQSLSAQPVHPRSRIEPVPEQVRFIGDRGTQATSSAEGEGAEQEDQPRSAVASR